MGRLEIEMAGLSDRGRVREQNEDAIAWDAEAGWAILADGMGGHLAGEVASAMAVDTLSRYLRGSGTARSEASLRAAVSEANDAIYRAAQAEVRKHNMGTTLLVLEIDGAIVRCAQVGDSRLYRWRQGELEQLSHDHSLVQELVDEGFLSRDEAAGSIHKNVITRALGLAEAVEADVIESELAPGELLLLCSDGLSDKLDDETMASLLGDGELPSQLQALVDSANQRGGEDNISAILIRVSAAE